MGREEGEGGAPLLRFGPIQENGRTSLQAPEASRYCSGTSRARKEKTFLWKGKKTHQRKRKEGGCPLKNEERDFRSKEGGWRDFGKLLLKRACSLHRGWRRGNIYTRCSRQ